MASHNLAQMKIGSFDLLGYSMAGEENVIAVPVLDVCFDIGKAPEQIIPINNVLLTHGHMDHSAGFAYYLSHRNFCSLPAGTLLAPAAIIEPIRQVLDSWARIDGNAIPANLVPVKPGDEYEVKPNIFARAFATSHSRGSVGYCVLEKRKKLKPEYLSLTGTEIINLKNQGVTIDRVLELPLVSYLGDTELGSWTQLDFVLNSTILIIECTFFFDDHVDRARAGKHMHVSDLGELMERSQNEHVLLMHVTQRTGLGDVRRILKRTLPRQACEKILVLEENNLSPVVNHHQ